MKRVVHIVLLVLLALVLLLAVVLGIYSYRNLHWYDENQRNLKRAGATEQQVTCPAAVSSTTAKCATTNPPCCSSTDRWALGRTTPTCCRS